VKLLGALPIVVEEIPFSLAMSDVLSRAREYGLSAYDAAYFDLAARRGLPLATRDSALQAACRKGGGDDPSPDAASGAPAKSARKASEKA